MKTRSKLKAFMFGILIILISLMFASIALSGDEFVVEKSMYHSKRCWSAAGCPWPQRCVVYCLPACESDRDCQLGWVCRIPTYEQLIAELATKQSTSAPPATQVSSRDGGRAIVFIEGVGPDTPEREVREKFMNYAQCVPPPGWPNITPPPGGWPSLPSYDWTRSLSEQMYNPTQPSPPAAQTAPPAQSSPSQGVPIGISIEQDTDRPGADFYSTSAKTVDECYGLCQKEPQCRVFTYYQGNCWLKNGVPAPTLLPGASSGILRR
jgi:hypothetical protein